MNRQYIGARYVPKFSDKNDGIWDNTYSYEPLEIVKHGADFYTSKIPVPTGIDITNTTYWVKTGDYNGAIIRIETALQELTEKVMFVFNTVSDAVSASDTLNVGDIIKTKGYYTAGDGGGAIYLITNEDTPTSISIGTKYGELQYGISVNIACLGAVPNTDITDLLNSLNGNVNNIFIPSNNYIIAGNVVLNSTSLIGDSYNAKVATGLDFGCSIYITTGELHIQRRCNVQNMYIKSNNDGIYVDMNRCTIHHCTFKCVNRSIVFKDIDTGWAGSCEVYECSFNEGACGIEVELGTNNTHADMTFRHNRFINCEHSIKGSLNAVLVEGNHFSSEYGCLVACNGVHFVNNYFDNRGNYSVSGVANETTFVNNMFAYTDNLNGPCYKIDLSGNSSNTEANALTLIGNQLSGVANPTNPCYLLRIKTSGAHRCFAKLIGNNTIYNNTPLCIVENGNRNYYSNDIYETFTDSTDPNITFNTYNSECHVLINKSGTFTHNDVIFETGLQAKAPGIYPVRLNDSNNVIYNAFIALDISGKGTLKIYGASNSVTGALCINMSFKYGYNA